MHAWLLVVTVFLGQVDKITPMEAKDREAWHKVTLEWIGPDHHEDDTPPLANPFLDYRMTVTFSKDAETYVVRG